VGAVGQTRDEVERLVRETVSLHLDGLRAAGEPVPEAAAVASTVIEAGPSRGGAPG
jgi:predicted RNase H-like HicB family nuclease